MRIENDYFRRETSRGGTMDFFGKFLEFFLEKKSKKSNFFENPSFEKFLALPLGMSTYKYNFRSFKFLLCNLINQK